MKKSILIFLTFILSTPIIFGSGWHPADEILSGNFSENYNFVIAPTFNGSDVQLRVGSSCAAGSSIRAINVDGNVVCETDDDTIISATNITNWDTAYSWGDHSSAGYLVIETDGNVTNEIQSVIPSAGLRVDENNDFGLINTCSNNQILKFDGVNGFVIMMQD